uniref:Ribonuclease H-like domain-containing protein n=1 Tax=Tanacetum cinerariifolium TaxID=118510 RepID=A0A699HE38_TANCI|nr:ribonuclease H-like domain-containing protein [Tanacetum cinerariifolium]
MDPYNHSTPISIKLLILDTGKFEQWKFRIQQYVQHEHYALWEDIVFRDSYKAPPKETAKDKGLAGIPHDNIDDKGYWKSSCSRHMTGNISYLSEYEPFNGGYVSFGHGRGNITGKGSIKTVNLSLRMFIRSDEHVMMRDPVANMCLNFLHGADSEQRTHEFMHIYLASATRVETTDGETQILAKVNGRKRTVSESSIRRHLKLNDEEVSQSKSTSFNEFSSNISTALVCLATNRTYNFSKMIFDGMMRNVKSMGKFLMHPRTVELFVSMLVPQDETAFPPGDVRYGEAFLTDTSLDAGQDMENIAKTSAMPHEALPRVTSLGGGKGNRDKSADTGSDITDEMANVLSTLRATNILASGGLRLVFTTASLSVATVSTSVSPAVATTSESFSTAVIFTTISVATPTTRVTRSSRGVVIVSSSLIYVNIPSISKKDKEKGKMTEPEQPSKEKVLEQISVQLARDLEAKFAQEDQLIKEQAERDSEIARIHAEKELEMMIAELDRSNEMVAKYLGEYEQAEGGLSHDEKVEEKFIPVGEKMQDFVPMNSKLESERLKRPGIQLDKERIKKLKTAEASVEELYIEALQALQRYMHDPLVWRIYDTCGVHHVSTGRGHRIFMLVEKDYPLTKGLTTLMLSNKLQVAQYSEMVNELLMKIYIIANSPR